MAALVGALALRTIGTRGGADGPVGSAGDDPASQEFVALYGTELTRDPAWRELLRKVSSPAEAQEVVRQLTARGVVRLDDATLRARATVLRSLLAADPLLCADVARGRATTATLSPVVMRLDPTARHTWYDVGAKAMLAELHHTPTPATPPEAVDAAFQALLAPLAPDQAARLRDVATRADASSDDDACWALRTLYDGAAQLPEAQGLVVLRALAKAS